MCTDATVAQLAEAIRARQRFVVVSHVRPDGDAVGSALAMTLALRALGKEVRVISHDPVPPLMRVFPATGDVEVVDRVEDTGDAVIVMECGDLARTGVAGLEDGFVINIDHHPDNTGYGALNWFDASAAACGEMVFTLIDALGVELSPAIATHVYITILTDTGGFHFSNISPRTFDICRRCVEAGVVPMDIARVFFYSNNLAKLRLYGAVLHQMQIDASGRIATVHVDREMLATCGATPEDGEGLPNLPLSVREIVAVAFFKETGPAEWRVSLRSQGPVDVNAIAREYGGGGHKNASGCSARGELSALRPVFEGKLAAAIAGAEREPRAAATAG